ncbi:hypothetical protein FRC09_014867 [Ceratobasidium sp. 395]|nr:hypothetical protein FRC09_014867 [Ceratobasidium sp. 395]
MVIGQQNATEPVNNTHISAVLERAEQLNQPQELRQLGQPNQSVHNESDAQTVVSENNNEAAKLLWYPFFYALCILPWSIIQWAGFVHHDILRRKSALAPSMVFMGISGLMGFFNVGLILWTRPTVLGLGSSQSDTSAVASRNVSPTVSCVLNRTAEGGVPGGIQRREWAEGEQARVDHQRTSSDGGAPVTLAREF